MPSGGYASDDYISDLDEEEKGRANLFEKDLEDETDEFDGKDGDVEDYENQMAIDNCARQNERVCRERWRQSCRAWVPEIHFVEVKLLYIEKHIDGFKGSYTELMAGGLLEGMIALDPESQEVRVSYSLLTLLSKLLTSPQLFAKHLARRSTWSITDYTTEEWLGQEPEEETSPDLEVLEQRAALMEESTEVGHELDDSDDKVNLGRVEEEDDQVNRSMQIDVPDVSVSLLLLLSRICAKIMQYRKDPNMYIPAHCLFPRMQMSVLCNLASHVRGVDLERLRIWPPRLHLPRSGIVPNRDSNKAQRAMDLLKDVELDWQWEPPSEIFITKDMVNISMQPDILTIDD